MEIQKLCSGCSATSAAASLERCRMCFRFFCADCAHRVRGASFCSEACGGAFMFGDDDEEENES